MYELLITVESEQNDKDNFLFKNALMYFFPDSTHFGHIVILFLLTATGLFASTAETHWRPDT